MGCHNRKHMRMNVCPGFLAVTVHRTSLVRGMWYGVRRNPAGARLLAAYRARRAERRQRRCEWGRLSPSDWTDGPRCPDLAYLAYR